MSSVINDIISIAKSKVAMIFFGLGKSIIIARYLGPELNGVITALLVYPSLFMTFGALGVKKSSAFLLASKQFEEKDIMSGILQAWLMSSVFSLISVFVLVVYLSNGDYKPSLICLALAPVPFSLLNTYLSGIYLGNNQIKKLNEVNWIPTALLFFSSFIFIVLVKMSIYGALLAELLAPMAMCLILISRMSLSKYLTLKVNKQLLKSLFSLGVAFAVSLVVINLNYRVDVVIMDWMSTNYEIGIYSKGSVLSQYLWQIPMLLGTIVFARGARAKDRVLFSKKVCQLLRVSLIIVGIGSIFLACFSKVIMLLLFGKEFLPSAEVMLWLLPGVLLLTIFKVLNMDMGVRGKPWFALKSMMPSLLINIILNIIFIPKYGSVGAAFTSTISYSLGAILFLVHYSKATGLSYRQVFTYSKADFAFLTPYLKKLTDRRDG